MQLRIGDHVMPIRVRAIIYWAATLIVAFELAAGGAWDILQIAYVHDLVVEHLGYPAYFLVILGVWKIPGAAALLIPRFPRLTEWAYAGAFFTYTGAVASHLAVAIASASGGVHSFSPASCSSPGRSIHPFATDEATVWYDKREER